MPAEPLLEITDLRVAFRTSSRGNPRRSRATVSPGFPAPPQ